MNMMIQKPSFCKIDQPSSEHEETVGEETIRHPITPTVVMKRYEDRRFRKMQPIEKNWGGARVKWRTDKKGVDSIEVHKYTA